ncbi:TRAP transporter permease [Aeromicrobium ponti]|uniref:TRAP transporter 4TM/12TM fusion protein n=1 Tax=Cytobacillus oceanisediminis TaxID=665099 RepID=A0A562JRE0_9BACI|nr:TRAP transporter permease [Cytobacillus oceanisediminis]TWH85708.1 TRAP transporter 4TM/12TM fusion protein [Cytobacillus oceanisediminis]
MKKIMKDIYDNMDRIEVPGSIIKGRWAAAVTLICVFMGLFHIYYNSYGTMLSIQLRAAHLAFVFLLIFILFPYQKGTNKERPSILDVILALLGSFVAMYMFVSYNDFATTGRTATAVDLSIAGLGILLLFEACRRTVGIPLVILSIIFLVYAKFGNLFPGGFKIVPFSTERIIYQMYFTETGIFGIVLGVSATFIFVFILFGAFLGENKSSEFFNDLSLAAAGHRVGGPGKVAVLGSALMGSISGSAVANVATTGTITIPLMKRIGYKPRFAGAVEAVASSGGSIMPPIMASSAFIMSEILGIPYLKIITAALIPALLYYLALWVMLDLEARKTGLKGLPKEELPKFKTIIKEKGHLIFPIVFVIYLLVTGRTPLFAGFWGIVATIVVSSLRKETRLSIAKIIVALRNGAIMSLSSAIACAIVGIIVGVSSMTGVGTMLASNIVKIAGGNLFFTLLLGMIACIILGMGLPTAACYITAATVVAPALTELGVLPIAAHMFVLYYAVLSNLTPPVALASFTAAGIADASPNEVSMTGLKLGAAGYLVPMMFAFSPILLLSGDSLQFGNVILAVLTATIGIIALGVALQKYFLTHLNWFEQGIALVVALLLIKPGTLTDIIGVIGAVIVIASQFIRKRKVKQEKQMIAS